MLVDLLQPNKSDALAYFDSGSKEPARYARALIVVGATDEPYLREYQVGPLPVKDGFTQVFPLDYPFNKDKGGYQRIYNLDLLAIAQFNFQVGANVTDITQDLLNGVSELRSSTTFANLRDQTAQGAANDTLGIAGSAPLIHEGDRVLQWNEFYVIHSGKCVDEDLLLTGLEFKTDVTGRDPAKWSVLAWYFNGVVYRDLDEFRQAMKSSDFVKPGAPIDDSWACTDQNGEKLPHDELNPPVPVSPDGARFTLDAAQKYVEWSMYESMSSLW